MTGVAVAGGDVVLHLLAWHLAIASPLSLGAVAFFGVAGGGALLRSRSSRALRWAQRNPWRFAAFPGIACAIVVFVLSMLDSGGMFGSAFTALWHGAAAYGLTGLVGSVGRPRRARGYRTQGRVPPRPWLPAGAAPPVFRAARASRVAGPAVLAERPDGQPPAGALVQQRRQRPQRRPRRSPAGDVQSESCSSTVTPPCSPAVSVA